MAATENVAVCPEVTVRLAGCVVIAGGLSTVSVAALLVTLDTGLVTITRKAAPLSVLVVAGVVYVDEVAPEILLPFFCH